MLFQKTSCRHLIGVPRLKEAHHAAKEYSESPATERQAFLNPLTLLFKLHRFRQVFIIETFEINYWFQADRYTHYIYMYMRNTSVFSPANLFLVIFLVSKSLTITNINTVLNIFVFQLRNKLKMHALNPQLRVTLE